ncbi:hypothetical protein Rumeso_01668 [Rubellimicrobium mesophilum DSM 19309]|uniref:Uncharacterized protein n=1 Tax=Rubellimicrobium mesophilum DSM 19309 TaxID=442562 RepID=A0A017HQW0_9RHOB|nr:hypothetical protein [Rubellimicrobium mesophilum]EYD76710.1 hypothetical protein Rumeso_01668 [Rubellimicrobium mesophilum DSM 19309]
MGMIRRVRADERGTVLVFVALALAVFLGLVAMSFDLGRVAATQSDLQSFADNMALAVAGELDGNADALTRAEAAAVAMITDTQSFGSGDRTLNRSDVTLTYLSKLGDETKGEADTVATTARAARFVKVDVNAHGVQMAFASAVSVLTGGSATNMAVAASAVAGFTQVACQVTPLMFCLPDASYRAEDHVGDMIRLRTARSGASWGPGDFGFLDTAQIPVAPGGPCDGLSGQKLDACLISGIGSVALCFDMRGVDTLPGQRGGQEDAYFNVRFDMYGQTMNNDGKNPVFAPAPNVVAGLVPDTKGKSGTSDFCKMQPQTDPATATSMALPQDTCIANDTCRFGSGDWDRAAYVAMNHNGTDPEVDPLNPRTRYQMYLDEIHNANLVSSTAPILPSTTSAGTTRPENGRPQCFQPPKTGYTAPDADRRVIVAAGIDCGANPVGGRTTGVPVKEFFRVFLTEPVRANGTTPPTFDILGEIVGSAGGAGSTEDDQFRDVVQLYR